MPRSTRYFRHTRMTAFRPGPSAPLPLDLRNVLLVTSALYLLALLSATCYWPGLSGPFLFDDYANLPALGAFNGVRDWATFKLYLFGNQSGPTGRPLAMLSFLIDDNNWPSDPRAFKYTNLMLHLLNGALLFWLCLKLLRALFTDSEVRPLWIALLAAGGWLLHPLHASTVLYPVQRMAMLSTLFVLAGLLAYAHGRLGIDRDRRSAYAWMSAGLILGTLLATFSKENGALLPLLALVLEVTIFRPRQDRIGRLSRYWLVPFLLAPSAALLGYLLFPLVDGSLAARFAGRPFTAIERLLTESRILFDYLYYWFIPRVDSPGILTQNFPLSRGLLDPPSTLAAVAGIATLMALAAALRRRWPGLSLAILFFFAGHLIESTLIPLELYYEHRNYLPSLFLLLPLAVGVERLVQRRRVWILGAVLLLGVPGLLTAERAQVWSSDLNLALQWARMNPLSQRAQRHAANAAMRAKQPLLALEILTQAQASMPEKLPIRLHRLILSCQVLGASRAEVAGLIRAFNDIWFDMRAFELLKTAVTALTDPGCRGVTPEDVNQMLLALSRNPGVDGPVQRRKLYHLQGLFALGQGDGATAAKMFEATLNEIPDIKAGLHQTALLAERGHFALALRHLEKAEKVLRAHPEQQRLGTLDYAEEIPILRRTITQDLRSASDASHASAEAAEAPEIRAVARRGAPRQVR
jgi:tetratricopeptide (TPR) repeat protein